MIQLRTHLEVADNSGVKKVWAIGVIGRANKQTADIGDVISVHVREADPDALAKKGDVIRCVVVRTRAPIRRTDGTTLKFDSNAVVLIECPRLLFPFAREIVATAVRNGGFPPLLLDPVDFVGLYRQRMEKMAPQPAANQS